MRQISYERVVDGPDTLRLYLKEISQFPQLTPEEEQQLGTRVQKGDEDAFRKLIESNLRFVVAMAKNLGITCGCFAIADVAGSVGETWFSLMRDVVFFVPTLMLSLLPRRRRPSPASFADPAAG